MTPHLILTVDYELFGNGSGCIETCVLSPANRMMQIAERVGAPITFFVEALEFMALADQQNDQRAQIQMRNALQKGHDVQLHLHPQWMNAVCDANGSWILDMSRWRIGDLNDHEVHSIIQQGKIWIENEIACNVPNYRCVSFRAGGWCIQPSERTVCALRDSGFLVDSTVAPGQWRSGQGEWSDFRDVPDMPVWKCFDNVCQAAPSGLWEIPIASGSIGKYQHLCRVFSARNHVNKGMAPGCIGSYVGPEDSRLNRFFAKLARITQLGEVMLDISTLSSHDLIRVTQQWLQRHASKSTLPIPIVAIAHTKNFSTMSEQSLCEYLEWVSRQNIQFSTYGNWLKAVSTHG